MSYYLYLTQINLKTLFLKLLLISEIQCSCSKYSRHLLALTWCSTHMYTCLPTFLNPLPATWQASGCQWSIFLTSVASRPGSEELSQYIHGFHKTESKQGYWGSRFHPLTPKLVSTWLAYTVIIKTEAMPLSSSRLHICSWQLLVY